jgi:glycosyltransferase involved in cell wall biosynthesis
MEDEIQKNGKKDPKEFLLKSKEILGVSIIICTYNGKNRMEKTLQAVCSQEVDFPFEILVVNNASNDDTENWLEEWIIKNKRKVPLRQIHESKPGLAHARIKGTQEASFSYLLFCDDDNWLSPGYLRMGLSLLTENPKIGVLGGCGEAVFETEKPSWFDQYSHSYAVGDLRMKSGKLLEGSALYGASCFYRKEGFQRLFDLGWESILSDRKGKSLSSGGDVEFCFAFQLIGYELHFEKRLIFYHFIERHRLNWNYYLKLKEGISSSFPLLESYKTKQFKDLKTFRKSLWMSYLLAVKGFLKTSLIGTFSKSKSNQVARRITKTKCVSFFKNYHRTIIAFERNQELFNA